MSSFPLVNRVRQRRLDRQWSQQELADRAGVARASVSAIEMGRLAPSTATALALAAALQCRVEDLFQLSSLGGAAPEWAWDATGGAPHRYWLGEVGGRPLLFPAEATRGKAQPHDGVAVGKTLDARNEAPPPTLVMACCDPAVEFLVAEVARSSGVRLLTFFRSSGQGLKLLKQGLVHVAGLHLDRPGGGAHRAAVQAELGGGYRLVHAAQWEEGVAVAPGRRASSLRSLLRGKPQWVGREVGSGSRQCLDEITDGKAAPRRIARDHHGVAEAVRAGWADAGVCPRLVAEEAGLSFFSVRHEAYEVCFAEALASDPRLQALTAALGASNYRRQIADLPGYNAKALGETSGV